MASRRSPKVYSLPVRISELERRVRALERRVGGGGGAGGTPIGGAIIWFTSTAPSGFLFANGSSFDPEVYPSLAVIYPSGKLPDLRDRFPLGAGGSRSVGATGGSETITVGQMPEHSHAHTHSVPSHNHGMTINFRGIKTTTTGGSAFRVTQIAGEGGTDGSAYQGDTNTQTSGPWTSGGASSSATGGGGTYWQPFYAVNYIIRAV